MNAAEHVRKLAPVLVEGLRVLTGEGIIAAAGHLSARIPGTDTFLINPRFPGVLADADDLCVADFSGRQISGRSTIPSETLIHAATYAARSDVMSVVHGHPRNAVVVGLLDEGLVPVHREAACFSEGVPFFLDSRNIVSHEQADRMVERLGGNGAIFLCGHGIAVADISIEAACTSAIRLEQSCEDQLKMMSLAAAQSLASAHGGQMIAGKASRGAAAYRNWPFYLHKHGLRSRQDIKAAITPPPEGQPAPR